MSQNIPTSTPGAIRHALAPLRADPPMPLSADVCTNQQGKVMHNATPKPLEALSNLRMSIALIAAGQPLPPILRGWLVLALRRRVIDPGANLDSLLGLRNRAGGRLSAFSKNPQRDRAIRAMVGDTGSLKSQAAAFLERVKAHRLQPDAELADIEQKWGRIPGSLAQLSRILAGHTRASQIDG